MKSFRVSNFRLFGREGTEVKFKPITVLTGANSSGKSSFVKAMVVFKDYLDTLIYDYQRDGSFILGERGLSFFNPKLKMKGFSSVVNRSFPGEIMSFSIELFPSISCYGGYNVSYSFVEDSNVLDQGALKSISLDIEGESVLRIESNKGKSENSKMAEKEDFVITFFNQNRLLGDFLTFCKYCVLPSNLVEQSRDEFGEVYPEYRDDNGRFSPEKTAQTPKGKRLAKIQGREKATYDYTHILSRVTPQEQNNLKSLFSRDLFDSVEKCDEYGLVFYFPVLERFVGRNKEESIEILNGDCCSSFSMNFFINEKESQENKLKDLIQAYKASDVESFIDFYRELEDYILENVNGNSFTFRTFGKTFNYIEDRIVRSTSISYDEGGLEKRFDEEGRLFSIAYEVMSSWQWAEEEKKDTQWMHFNNGGVAVTELWGKDDEFITRSIYEYPVFGFSSRHILFEAYQDYLRYILTECLIPKDLTSLVYNTGSFASVQRLHTFEEDSDFVDTMRKYLAGKAYWEKNCQKPFWGTGYKPYVPDTFLNKWLGDQGLCICKKMRIENVEGLGFKISMVKSNEEEEALADMGHGITQVVSILLQIETAFVNDEIINYTKAALNEGYADLELKEANTIIAIEEPEVSLHPCYQSLLADILKDAVESYGMGISFIVETHSEYLVRKMQAIVSSFTREQFESNPFAVYYFTSKGEAYDMGFTPTGRFEKTFGSGFFDESARSKYEVLKREELDASKEQK